ncbi:hypothetical protein N800_11255 [Lysobacter daejeonensis GH1-9]|uniref:Type I restriction modification DNA specificity domain-containing protein n=1 Tax=Lysobacter daejeonensis GH1-9 TaxID=1385517 RepID=A0A0A0EQ98_9GAMM|nr:restriction endonuclease subunit S [Lysobacter daejeonensis]KGM52649.1 hypothetical protein N800_11255 [Lysobacter daejeonensis GH1-9]
MSWKERRLGDVLTLKRGYDLPEAQRRPGDVPVISSSGITGSHNMAMVAGPGVVTGRYGTMGEVFYVEGDYWPHNTALYVRDFKGNNPRFIAYFLKNALRGTNSNKAAVPGVNRNDLHERKVCSPDLETQGRIVEQLLPIDDLIENNRRRIALLEQSARLLYREWFVHLRFPGHEHVKVVDGVPEGWAINSIAEMFDTTSGGTPSRSVPEYFVGDINWVKTQELDELFIFDTEEHISEAALKNSAAKLFPEGTLLVSIYGGTNIGSTGLLAKAAASNQACVALMPKRHPDDVLFAQKWLQENRGHVVGLGQGAAQTNISQQTLRSQKMLVPTVELLDEFVGAIKPMYQQMANLCQQNTKLRDARDLLLPRLMSGDLAV